MTESDAMQRSRGARARWEQARHQLAEGARRDFSPGPDSSLTIRKDEDALEIQWLNIRFWEMYSLPWGGALLLSLTVLLFCPLLILQDRDSALTQWVLSFVKQHWHWMVGIPSVLFLIQCAIWPLIKPWVPRDQLCIGRDRVIWSRRNALMQLTETVVGLRTIDSVDSPAFPAVSFSPRTGIVIVETNPFGAVHTHHLGHTFTDADAGLIRDLIDQARAKALTPGGNVDC